MHAASNLTNTIIMHIELSSCITISRKVHSGNRLKMGLVNEAMWELAPEKIPYIFPSYLTGK